MELLFFWLFSAGMLLGGVSVVVNRNPVASALSLVVSIVFMAGLYVTLNAFFLAALQVVVYAGAVMVLFLFVIMLLDIKKSEKKSFRFVAITLGLALCSGLMVTFLDVIKDLRVAGSSRMTLSSLPQYTANDIQVIGSTMFNKYLLPFEVTSVLLLVATVGVILLSKREIK